jgi:hypothetical protein
MRSGEFYYLVMVCVAFATFGLVVAANYVQYRQWLKQPVRRR